MFESPQSNTLQVGERKINYTVTRTSGTRNVHMTLRPNLTLEVSIPASSRIDVKAILKKKRAWIERKLDEISESKKIFDGRKVLYKGSYHRLVFVSSPTQRIM